MQKEDLVYLGHMLDNVRQAIALVEGKSRDDYDADVALRLALTRLIQVIGEAARKVSQECREAQPEIPWRLIVGMRHKVVHDYMDVDEDIVWKTVTENLPALIESLEEIVPPET